MYLRAALKKQRSRGHTESLVGRMIKANNFVPIRDDKYVQASDLVYKHVRSEIKYVKCVSTNYT